MQGVEIERVEISLPTDEISILHLSDLHISLRHTIEDIDSLVSIINRSSADIAVITGDLIDTKPSKIEYLLNRLSNIKKDTYFISGNHDLFYGYDKLCKILQKNGIEILDQSFREITIRGVRLELIGLADRFAKFFSIKRDMSFIKPKKAGSIRLFLAHQPKDYRYALKYDSDIFLCGHTHGGQIYPFHYLVKLSQPFLSGYHKRDNLHIFVSRGIGTWGIHHRFRADAHIPLIVMRREDEDISSRG